MWLMVLKLIMQNDSQLIISRGYKTLRQASFAYSGVTKIRATGLQSGLVYGASVYTVLLCRIGRRRRHTGSCR